MTRIEKLLKSIDYIFDTSRDIDHFVVCHNRPQLINELRALGVSQATIDSAIKAARSPFKTVSSTLF